MRHTATRLATPADSSRTMTTRDAQPREEAAMSASGDDCEQNPSQERIVGVLRLRARRPRGQGPRVAWTEDVVDNEGMGKKKSKICCIYHKPRRFDESSDESSSDSDSDSDSSCGGSGHNHPHPHPHPLPHGSLPRRVPPFRRHSSASDEGDDTDSDGYADGAQPSNAMRDARRERTVKELESGDEVNAYERPPSGKGKKVNGKGKAKE